MLVKQKIYVRYLICPMSDRFPLIGHGEITMKRITAALVLTLISAVSYAKPYQCVGYIDDVAVGEAFIVNADKTPTAEDKAYSRLKKKGLTVDYVACK